MSNVNTEHLEFFLSFMELINNPADYMESLEKEMESMLVTIETLRIEREEHRKIMDFDVWKLSEITKLNEKENSLEKKTSDYNQRVTMQEAEMNKRLDAIKTEHNNLKSFEKSLLVREESVKKQEQLMDDLRKRLEAVDRHKRELDEREKSISDREKTLKAYLS